jgi:SNF2 family DNA or RNA helicase
MTPAPRKSLVKIKDETVFYPHQVEGIRHMARLGSFILADDMGLGKTIQALTVAAIDFERGWCTRVLVVTMASLKYNVVDDIEKMTHFTYTVLEGTPAKRAQQLKEFDKDILIINYEQVKPHLDELNRMGFQIVIFDEAHAMKNNKSHRTKACLQVRGDRYFLLTGSPLLNQVNELWPLLHKIDPAAYPNYWRFVNRYAVFGGYKDKQIVGVKNQRELRSNLESVMIRRLKKDVLDLPDKQYLMIPVDFHPEQAKLYKQAVDEMKIDLPGNPNPMELENALSKMLRLKQICGTTYTLTDEDYSIKLDVAMEKAKEIMSDKGDQPGEPLVIFTQFRRVQEAMVNRLSKEGYPSFILNGDTPTHLRVENVRCWAEHNEPSAMVAMLQVAGVGLNMTAASKCIFLDKLFVPKLNEQAEDRLHRIGADKTKPIQIIQIVVRNSIEHRIETILRRKKKLFDTLVEESDWKKSLFRALLEEEGDAA